MKLKLELNLLKKDYKDLQIKVGSYGVTLEEIVVSYLQDLICSSRSNGSDERDLANEYFERSIINYGDLE